MIIVAFIVGLCITSLTAQRLSDGGIEPREGAVLLIMAILTAWAMLAATVVKVTELRRYGPRSGIFQGLAAAKPAKDKGETHTVSAGPEGGALLREYREPAHTRPTRPSPAPVHSLDRTWTGPPGNERLSRPAGDRPAKLSIREDQKLPPGAENSPTGPGTAEPGERRGDR